VEAFLAGNIPFPAIAATVAETLDRIPNREPQTIAEVLEIDRASREAARRVIDARWGKKVTTEAVLRA
jgi:1-deoxy-D-xylulose 5-phosphate reductoisomerase